MANPAAPVRVGGVALSDEAKDVVLNGTVAYVAAYTGSLQVLRVANPAAPTFVMKTDSLLGGYLMDVAMAPPFVFGADVVFVNGVPIFDAGGPTPPIPTRALAF